MHRNIVLLAILVHAVLGHWVQAQQSIPPFAIVPANQVPDGQLPGRDYFLASHKLRMELAFKISVTEKLDEEWKEGDKGAPFQSKAEAELSDIALTSVRERDYAHHYFMAFGQVSGFFRLAHYAMNFSDDGFLAGAETTFEDQTLSILLESAKIGLAVAAAPKNATQDQEKIAEQNRKAREAARLKAYIAALQDGLTQSEKEIEDSIKAQNLSPERAEKLQHTMSLIRTELAAAQTQRAQVVTGAQKSDVAKLVVYLDRVNTIGWRLEDKKYVRDFSLDLTKKKEWKEFERKIRTAFGDNAVQPVIDKLPTKLTLALEGKPPAQKELRVFGNDGRKPFRGLIYRRPAAASAVVYVKVKDTNGSGRIEQPAFHTDGTTLKFGQLGAVVALPIIQHAFAKGDLAISFNADGDVTKLASGNASAVGATLNTAASGALQAYQNFRKAEASGGFDTDLLNAETARLKAQIDNINAKNTLQQLQGQH